MKVNVTYAAVSLGLAALFAGVSVAHANKPDWQQHLDWSMGNETGPDKVNCPDQYAQTEPKALVEGGRAALMRRAIASAKADNFEYAFRLAVISQCHSGHAQQQLAEAGVTAVGGYLKAK